MREHQPLNNYPLPLKLRVEDYLLLDAAGAFEAYRKTELIEGEVRFMNAQHRPHARAKTRLALLLSAALEGSGLEVVVEGSVAMPPVNVPEPDLVVTSEAQGEGLIPIGSVRLIVEVADTTLQGDLGRKAALYADGGVPEYWVVDLQGRVIHRMWGPTGTYQQRDVTAFGMQVTSTTITGLRIETSAL